MSEKMKKQELNAEEMGSVSGGMGEKQRFMVMKEEKIRPFDAEEEAQQKAKEMGAGWKVVRCDWDFIK